MILVVGLGNPGEKYGRTRHNIGFRAVDEFQRNNNFPEFSFSKKFQAEISEGILNNENLVVVKPRTFMNLSGKAVKSLIRNYKLEAKNLIIVHDDIDLPLGKIRVVKNRGAGGHKGVESIIHELGTKNFIRFRVGICPKSGKPKNPEKFVLQKPSEVKLSEARDETKSHRSFNKSEEEITERIIKKTAKAVEILLKEGLEKTMNEFNK